MQISRQKQLTMQLTNQCNLAIKNSVEVKIYLKFHLSELFTPKHRMVENFSKDYSKLDLIIPYGSPETALIFVGLTGRKLLQRWLKSDLKQSLNYKLPLMGILLV